MNGRLCKLIRRAARQMTVGRAEHFYNRPAFKRLQYRAPIELARGCGREVYRSLKAAVRRGEVSVAELRAFAKGTEVWQP